MEEKGATDDEMIGRHHQLNGHEFAQTLGDGEEQGSLVCCSPWDRKELNTTLAVEQQRPVLPHGRRFHIQNTNVTFFTEF